MRQIQRRAPLQAEAVQDTEAALEEQETHLKEEGKKEPKNADKTNTS